MKKLFTVAALAVLASLNGDAQISNARSGRLSSGATGPNSALCVGNGDADRVYIFRQTASPFTLEYRCRKTGASTWAWVDVTSGGAVSGITSLGGLTNSSQVFANDTNVTISSVTSTHTLGWAGILAPARGGTNNAFTAFTGPTTSTRTFTLPDTSTTILTTNAAVTVAQGGTGIASGTSGGVPYFSGSTTIASSGALTASAILLGGGAGAAPTALGSLGTTTTLLHGNAAGAPTFGAVSLTADVSGTLPVGSGGTGATSLTIHGVLVGNTTSAISATSAGTSGQCLVSNGASADPTFQTCGATPAWSAIANPSGNLALTMGTNTSAFTFSTGTSTSDMFSIIDTTGNTGTGHLLEVHSVGTSTMKPVRFTAGGTANGVELDATGALAAIGTGNINATKFKGNTTVAVGDGGTGLTSGTSGGVPYYSGSTTIASSGALTANLPVIGGGAGVAPSVGARSGNTTTFGTTSGTLTNGHCLQVDASGNIVDSGSTNCGGGGSTSWNTISNPSGNLALAMSTNTTQWTVSGNTSTSDMFSIIDTTGNTGTGHLLEVHSVGSSATKPVRFTAGGTANGVEMDSAGALTAIGSGGISATLFKGNATVAVADGGTGAVTLTGLLQGNGTSAISAISNSSTTGQALRVTGTSTYAWGAIDLANASAVTGILAGGNGGTGNGFFAVTGPTTSLKTFTLPNASAAILTDNAAVTVAQGGTGRATLTNHGVLIGASTTAITQLAAAAAGTVLAGQGASSDPAFTATPTFGVAGTTLGTIALTGNTSGTITIQPQAAAGTYNFNLPTGAGTSGQPLLSGGGSSTAMTFGTLSVGGGGTGATTLTIHGVLIGNTTSAISATSAGTSGQCLLSNGASSDPTFQSCPSSGISGLTTTAIVTAASATTIQTPSATSTLDSSGNMVLAGTMTTGSGVTSGGGVTLGNATGDTAASFFEANSGDGASNAEPAYLKLWSSHSTKRKAALFPCTNADGFFCIATTTPAADASNFILTTDNIATLTQKTYDTAGTGNSFSINGVAVTANTGTGSVARATSPTFVTPTLGAATATSINGLTITSSTGTLTVTNAKVVSVSNTLTFTGTDSSSVAFSGGGTVAYTANNLSVFAATTSAQLLGVLSDETGSGVAVFGTSPTISGIVGTGAADFSGATSLKIPVGAGATTGTNGFIAYDSTNNMLHGAQSSADAKIPQFTITPADNDCVKWTVSGSNYKLGTAGAACGSGSGGGSGSPIFSAVGTGTGPSNTASETSVIPSVAIGSKTIAANTFVNGTVLEVWASGYFSLPAVADSLTLKYKCGSTVIGSASFTPGAGVVTNGVWRFNTVITASGTGAAGVFMTNTIAELTGSGLAASEAKALNTSTVAYDFTTSCAFDVSATWGGAQSGESISGTNVAAWIPGAPVSSVFGLTGAVNSLSGGTANSITLAGMGFPTIGWQSVLSNSSATSLVTLATAPGAGEYVIHYSLDMHTPCTTGAGSLALSFGWTGNSARTEGTGSWSLPAAQATSSFFSGVQPIHVVSGNVTYTPTLNVACASGTATWDGVIWLERVN